MPKPNTIQFAGLMMNATPNLIYQQILPETTPPTPRPKLDTLGTGDFEFVGFHPARSRLFTSFKQKGLFVRTTRPSDLPAFNLNGDGVTSNIAGFRVPPPGSANPLPDEFVVAVTFRAPTQTLFTPSAAHPIPAGDHPGEWAPVIVIFNTDLDRPFFAATAQFRPPITTPPRVRLNLPGTGFSAGLPNIEDELSELMTKKETPLTFTLILHVNRSTAPWRGHAMMFVGDENCYPDPSDPTLPFPFTFGTVFTSATILTHIGAGIATGGGGRFDASTEIHEFEIWTKA